MRSPNDGAAVAILFVSDARLRDILARGEPFSTVARFEGDSAAHASVIVQSFTATGFDKIVRVETLVSDDPTLPALTPGVAFELLAGPQILARAHVLIAPELAMSGDDRTDRPASDKWGGSMEETMWAA